ncbi:mitochondrial protein Pet127-domain-containing protein [Plectosphaerella plurivora]|uniref:Mitochondrial protein Pet127-domain-containing protein n=1 Tax=Plectosphaerella plurivora TaxID=936078 RepID=A0A9P8VBX3_9PEZI|nr:mitochondrial protein Pet127-domain-containing protein [Plectosphaerella plurivora]
MLQVQFAAVRGLQRHQACSACLIRSHSSLQSWRRLATVQSSLSLTHSFATSTSTETSKTDPQTTDLSTDAAKDAEPKDATKTTSSKTKNPFEKRKPEVRRVLSKRPETRTRATSSKSDSVLSKRPESRPRATSTSSKNDSVLKMVLNSLKQLEQNYASLSDGMNKLNSVKTPPGEEPSPIDEAPPKAKAKVKATPEEKAASKELRAKMKRISSTLDVLKNVLQSQNIPIDGLGAKSKTTKPKPTKKTLPAGEVLEAKPKRGMPKKATPKKATPAEESVEVKPKKTTPPEESPMPETNSEPIPEPKTTPPEENLTPKTEKVTEKIKSSTVQDPCTSTATKPPPLKKGKAKAKANDKPVEVHRLSPTAAKLVPVEQPTMPPVAKLAYGLDRVLFNPGVYMLQDPRSKVYNFDPYLSKIMPLNEFDFGALQRYVTSSKDSTLNELASKLGKKYSGSTSSMTSMLAHFHFLLSNWRPISSSNLTKSFPLEYDSFNLISRAPAATFLHLQDGVYSIDADKEHDSANILSMLGKSMEKLLTLNKEDFERYRHVNSDQITEEERNAAEAYHFSTLGDFLMRSQLDATDPRLPGTGMFDLKTRAVISIRMDAAGFQKGLGYEIRNRFGEWESFEREYFDMIRSAFLKYSLQVRMGRMDGIYVAFHNTQRIFGFQYIPLSEMDQALHGTTGDVTTLGDQEFKLSLQLLNKVLDRATERFPGRNIRLHVETRPGNPPYMYVFAKPVTPDEIEKVQTANHAAIAQFENKFLGLQQEAEDKLASESDVQQTTTTTTTTENEAQVGNASEDAAKQDPFEYWEEMREKVEEAVEDDARGISHVRESIQEALEQSGLLKAKSPAEARVYVSNLLDALVRTNEQDTDKQEVEDAADEMAKAEEAAEAQEAAEAKEAEEESAATEASSEASATSAQPTTTDSSRSSGGSLKDLIVKAAERLDERLDDTGALISDDDAAIKSELRDFEFILSELIAERSDLGQDESGVEDLDLGEPKEAVTIEKSSFLDSFAAKSESEETEESPETDTILSVEGDEILGMHVMVRSLVNGKYVGRVSGRVFNPKQHKWTIEYSIEEIETAKAKALYKAIQTRRRKAFENGDQDRRDANWRQMFKGKLEELSKRGSELRRREDAKAAESPVYMVDSEEPISPDEAFAQHRQWKEMDLKK